MFYDKKPVIPETVYIADNASVIGGVKIGEDSSVYFGAVIRGDSSFITIGKRTNVQDLSVIHCPPDLITTIGDDVTIGHRAIVHGCTVGNRVLIGMGAIIMNGAEIGDDCIIGAGALITEKTVIPPRTLVIGFPAKPKRELTEEEIKKIMWSSGHYAERGREYRRMFG